MSPPGNSNEYSLSLKKKVIEQTDLPGSFVEIVIAGYDQQIRKSDVLNAKGAILMELPQIVKEYGGRENIPDSILKECVLLILKKFSMIAVFEIREAYRLWSIGEIAVKGGEMYGGQFNAGQLGKVLGAYCQNRKKVLGTYLREKEEMINAAKEQSNADFLRMKFEAEFPGMIQQAREENINWRKVPAYWYQAALDRDMISFEQGEAQLIYQEAMQIAKLELEQKEVGEGPKRLAHTLQKIDSVEELENRAKVIARKLTVFRKLIK